MAIVDLKRNGLLATAWLCSLAGVLGCATVHIGTLPPTSQPTGEAGKVQTPSEIQIPQSSPHAKLVLDDPDLGPWMRINNTFIDTAPLDYDESWHGFLLQLGGWYEDRASANLNIWFHSVSIVSAAGTKKLECSTATCDPFDLFEWINIVPRSDSRRPPLPDPVAPESMAGNPNFLEILYPRSGTAGMCQNFENFCGCENFSLCNQTSAAGCGAFGERKLCLRLRSLHAWFVPRAILTYWAGGSGYDVTVTGGHHPQQIFTFKDPIDVYVHMRDGAVDFHLDVKEITIRPGPGGDHGNHNDPPMGQR